VINKATGKKFGKTEGGAVWLEANLTSPTQFYQFWINCDDEGVEDYMKIYTLIPKEELEEIMAKHRENPRERFAQLRLAQEVTRLVHGDDEMNAAEAVTQCLTGKTAIGDADDAALDVIRKEIPSVKAKAGDDVLEVLVKTELATSKSEARRLLQGNAIVINGQKTIKEQLEATDFQNGRLLIRKGKAFKDSALVEQS
jgi:tyrosyl-tRNA synthetase